MDTGNFDSQKTVACCSGSDFIYFDSLDSLFKWDGQTHTTADDIVRMRNFRWKNDRPKTLLCHDHRGGFLQYESKNGIDLCANTADPSNVPIYSFFHWWYIDVFVYFSHHFITVPPAVWTNQAHFHGVLMLGTFITEADELCSQIFSNKRIIDQLVSRMTHLCKEYHFDGWLINIENIIEPGNLNNIEYFLSKLREVLRIEVHNCTQVIWYDSVTDRGELKWQNELNQCNRRWFNAVDGFYTNYAWNEQHIHRTLKTLTGMTPERSPFDIYVGIDVFGRGCLGGGGWNCAEPMEILRRYGLSAAIFAPGWICEKFPGSQRILFENSFLFWNSLKPYLFLHKMRERKLCTNFSIGFSSDCELGSFECREEDRFCMLNASVQPFYLGSPGFAKDLEPGLIINGGGLHDLFVCDISIQELDRHLEVRYCSSARIGIAVTISNGRNVLHLYNSTAFEESEDKPDAKARATCSEEAGGIKNLVEETPAECSLQPQIQKASLIEEEREKIPFEERVKQFKELLKEVGITSTSKLEDEQQNLVFDHRYLLLSAAERKATFYAYCLERQSETKEMDERKVDDEKGENEKTVILDLKEEATVVTVMKKSVEETCHFSLKDRADWRIEKVQLWTPPDTKNLRVYHFEMCLK